MMTTDSASTFQELRVETTLLMNEDIRPLVPKKVFFGGCDVFHPFCVSRRACVMQERCLFPWSSLFFWICDLTWIVPSLSYFICIFRNKNRNIFSWAVTVTYNYGTNMLEFDRDDVKVFLDPEFSSSAFMNVTYPIALNFCSARGLGRGCFVGSF